MQDFNHARLTKEARAQNDLARPIKEARAPNVKTDSKNTIIVHILEGSNPVRGSKSCTNLTSRTNFTNCKKGKNWIKAKKADKAKSRDWPPRAFIESPYKLRSKLKSIVTKLIVKRTKFSDTIVKMAKAMLVAKVKEKLE